MADTPPVVVAVTSGASRKEYAPLYTHKTSPLGVYSQCRSDIEKQLINASESLRQLFAEADRVNNSLTYALLVKECGARREPSFLAPDLVWFEVLKRTSNLADEGDDNNEGRQAALKATGGRTKKDIVSVSKDNNLLKNGEFVPVSYRTLLSLSVFLNATMVEILTGKQRDNALRSWALPKPFDSVSVALGLKKDFVLDTSAATDRFTLARLQRAIRGEYILNHTSHILPWRTVLVNVSSGLLENLTICAQKRGGLSVAGALWRVHNSPKEEQWLDTSDVARTHNMNLLVEIPFSQVLLVHDSMLQDIKEFMYTTDDDVLVVRTESLSL